MDDLFDPVCFLKAFVDQEMQFRHFVQLDFFGALAAHIPFRVIEHPQAGIVSLLFSEEGNIDLRMAQIR